MILEVPDSFTFQACSKERTDVGQKCNQPKEEQTEQVTNIVMITLGKKTVQSLDNYANVVGGLSSLPR